MQLNFRKKIQLLEWIRIISVKENKFQQDIIQRAQKLKDTKKITSNLWGYMLMALR